MDDGEKERRLVVVDMKEEKELRERRRMRREEKMVRWEAGGNLRARRKERERMNGRARRMRIEMDCLEG